MNTRVPSNALKILVLLRLRAGLVRDIISLRPARVLVLDQPPGEVGPARQLEKVGIPVEYPDFFAGDLCASNGQSVYLTARDISYTAAAEIVGNMIERSAILKSIDAWGRPGTLNIRLQKCLSMPLFRLSVALETARVLSIPHSPIVWLDVSATLPANSLHVLARDLETKPLHELPIAGWLRSSKIALGLTFLRGVRSILGLLPSRVDALAPAPTILTAHEEDLTDDRSHRSMLHWLDHGSMPPKCRTVVMPQRGAQRYSIRAELLAQKRIVLLSKRDIARSLHRAKNVLQDQIRSFMWQCFWRGLTAPTGAERNIMMEAWRLLCWAEDIAAVTEITGARAWVGCEGWQTPMDAVNIIADRFSMKTCHFQYSSIRGPTPLMVTTADVAATIGDTFASLFRWGNIGAREFKATGYPYGYVFPLIRPRAQSLRKRLESLGVKFVLGYYDESVQYSRWGLISKENHLHELTLLARAVIEDPTLGVIVKPKYTANNLKLLYPEDRCLQAALNTGRLLVMEMGQHRNALLPAETALSCDICIGHLFAASAALEAVFCGTRALLIRRYGEKTLLDAIVSGLDVVYPSMDVIIDRIGHFRTASPGTSALGDWLPVLPDLDPYRDGKAAERLRERLEGWALSD